MKKLISALVVLVLLCIAAIVIFSDDNKKAPEGNTSVEELIAQDFDTMDSVPCGRYVFFESRVVLQNQFNESDKFAAEQVTNVFQTYTADSLGGTETDVYFFTHELNECGTIVDIHRNAFVTDDIAIEKGEIVVYFDEAFNFARQSNFVPSRSKYMTLRHGFGPNVCNPFYVIGNDKLGKLWVDATNGDVFDKDPAGL